MAEIGDGSLQEARQDARQDSRFSELSYFILESLRTLSGNVATLQKSLTAIEVSLVSRADLKELRDYTDGKIQRLSDRHDEETNALREKVTQLQIKTATISALAGAATSFLVHLLTKS